MTVIYLVQHAEKQPAADDPELTERGRNQAARTGRWLRRADLGAVYSSPLRRAWQTAEFIGAAAGLDVRRDDRLRERMNWDGSQPMAEFLADWTRSVRDRDFVPRTGASSRQAAARLLGFLQERAGASAAVAVVTHGGVTVDLLRTLLGDEAVPGGLMEEGVPPCAITTLDDMKVIDVASVDHLPPQTTRPYDR